MHYYKRQLEAKILKANEGFPVVLLTGARQVGKSTMLRHLSDSNRTYVSLDDPTIRLSAQSNPETFFDIYQPPVLVDEIQYAPELFPYIKIIVDQRNEAGLFWLTGSQIFQLMKNVQESLAGRVAVLNLFPLAQSELLQKDNEIFPQESASLIKRFNEFEKYEIPDINVRIFEGGMPRFVLNADVDRDLFFSSYLQTYIARDVGDITHILDTNAFINFIRLLASRTAQELNLNSLGVAIGIDATTARRWLDLLLLSGIAFILPAWSRNLGKRLIKRPKIYFADTGFCCYLSGISSANEVETSINAGALFENYIVSEIYKTWSNQWQSPSNYYYKDTNQKEIDLIIEKNQKVYPFEIKRNANPKNAFRNMNALDQIKSEIPFYGVFCNCETVSPLGEDRWLIPWWLI